MYAGGSAYAPSAGRSAAGGESLASLSRAVAAVLPALIIAYSALVDPLINLNMAASINPVDINLFGGIDVSMTGKSRSQTKFIMPAFLALSCLAALLARPAFPRRLGVMAVPGALVVALAVASTLWAKQPMNTLTLALYQVILFSSLLLCVATAADPRKILNHMTLMFAMVVAVNLAIVALYPPGPSGHPGIYEHKNTLGAAAGCAFLFGLFHLFEGGLFRRAVAVFVLVGSAYLTRVSDSKTALAFCLAAPVIAVGLFVTSRYLMLKTIPSLVLLAALCVPAFLVASTVFGFDMDDILIATYGDSTFTGRTEIWGFIADHIRNAPMLGHGFRGFWSIGTLSPKHGSEIEFIRTIGSGHNGFMDITLDLGLLGLGLLVAMILLAIHMAGRFELRPLGRSLFYLSMIFFLIGRNMMESALLWSTYFDNLCFLLVAFLACYAEPLRSGARRNARQVARHHAHDQPASFVTQPSHSKYPEQRT